MQNFKMQNVKGLLLITASFLLQANSVPLISAAEDSASPPNIVFLFADDQCTYSVGCYGNKDVRTPNMDQLARDGVVFDKHYNTTAICMASRANVFTGMYISLNAPHGPFIAPDSYAKRFRDLGYDKKTAGRYGMIENIDDNLGRLEVFLEKEGLKENTILLYLSDNGTQSGQAKDIFNAGTDQLAQVFKVNVDKQRIDSVHIKSNMRRLSRIGIFQTKGQFEASVEANVPHF